MRCSKYKFAFFFQERYLIVCYKPISSFSFTMEPLHWSSIFPTSREHKNYELGIWRHFWKLILATNQMQQCYYASFKSGDLKWLWNSKKESHKHLHLSWEKRNEQKGSLSPYIQYPKPDLFSQTRPKEKNATCHSLMVTT